MSKKDMKYLQQFNAINLKYLKQQQLDIEQIIKLKDEMLQHGFLDIYSYYMDILCDFYLLTGDVDEFCVYMNELLEIGKKTGGFPLIYALLHQGFDAWWHQNDIGKGIEFFEDAQKTYISTGLNDPMTFLSIMQCLGAISCMIGDYKTAYHCFTKALSCKLPAIYNFKKSATYKWLGKIEHDHHNLKQAIYYLKKSIEILKKHNQNTTICDAMNSLGDIYNQLKNYDEAFIVLSEAKELASKCNLPAVLADVYNNLGIGYNETGEYQRAEEHFRKSLEHRENQEHTLKYAMVLQNLALTFENMKKYNQAEKFYIQALDSSENCEYPPFTVRVLCNFGRLCLVQKRYTDALKYFQKAEKLIETVDDSDMILMTYEHLIIYYLDKEDYKTATKYLCLHKDKAFKVYEQRLKESVEFQQIKYGEVGR